MSKKPTRFSIVGPANPEKKPISEIRTDSWANTVTGLGMAGDKRLANRVFWDSRPLEEYEQMYAGDEICSRIVNLVPEEALRRGWELTQVEKEPAALALDICQKLDVRGSIERTWKWARAYGGAVQYIVTDAMDPSQPLNIKREKVMGLRDLSRYDLRIMSTDIESDFGSPNWGQPNIYYLMVQMGTEFKSYPIHHTRVIRYDGYLVPRRTYIRNNYWHDSVLQRLFNVVRNYQTSNDAAATILQDFNIGVYKMKNLSNLISAGKEAVVKKRIEMLNYSKSVVRAMLLDSDEEEYQDLSRNVTGLADLLKHQGNRLVAATDIPHTKLLGESPDGSSATGNSTTTQWYDYIQSEQENYLRPKIKRLFEVLFPQMPELDVKFKPLWQLDELEQADLRNKQAQTDGIYLDKGVLDPTEVAQSRFGGEDYSTETTLDQEARDQGLIGMPDGPEQEEGDPEKSDESSGLETKEPAKGSTGEEVDHGGAAPYIASPEQKPRNSKVPGPVGKKTTAQVGISMSDPMYPKGTPQLPPPGAQKQKPRTYKQEAPGPRTDEDQE